MRGAGRCRKIRGGLAFRPVLFGRSFLPGQIRPAFCAKFSLFVFASAIWANHFVHSLARFIFTVQFSFIRPRKPGGAKGPAVDSCKPDPIPAGFKSGCPAGLPPRRSPSARVCEIARVEHRKRIFPSPRPPSRLRKPQKFFRFPLSGGAPFRRDQASRLPFGSEVRKALLRLRRDQAPRPMRFPRSLRVRKSPTLTKFFMPFKHSISIEN